METVTIPARYTRLDALQWEHSLCRACGGAGAADRPACRVAVCEACGTPQCGSHGRSSGRCAVCHIGYLSGWSHGQRRCRYKGCSEPPIALDGAFGYCRGHCARGRKRGMTVRVTLAEYIAERLAERARGWALISRVSARPCRGSVWVNASSTTPVGTQEETV